MNDLKRYILDNELGKVYENKSFKELTTLRIGGKIQLVYYPNTIDNFLTFYEFFKDLKIELFIIGAGSNIFASDKIFKGVVVSFRDLDIRYFRIEDKVTAYPGCSVVRLAYDLATSGYSGGEFLAGIPASIGGAVYMNAGANGSEIKDILVSGTVLDNNEIKDFSNEDFEFEYRKSILHSRPIILLEAKFKFFKEKENFLAVRKIKELKEIRKKTQPIDKACAGCCFQNPKECPAWKLIDKIGLRGYNINDAKVSEKHTNFVINEKSATSTDMKQLIDLIKSKVKEKYNIDLKSEWILVNFD